MGAKCQAVSTPTASHCDDVLSNCDIVNKTLGVCNNFEAARKSCAKFCGLCGIVDGVWSGWSNWDFCSVTCGQGTMTRTRSCSNPPPHDGGKTCPGLNTGSKGCMLRACPVDGGWTDWLQWSSCSVSYEQTRQRLCLNPAPEAGGRFCVGPKYEQRHCYAFDCLEILQKRFANTDGVYPVKLKQTGEIINVFCDMTTDGGGWTVFQKRFNGGVNFYRNWHDYENGFGKVTGEFWLGLKYIYQMTKDLTNELRIDLEKSSEEKAYEVYQSFSISSFPGYTLRIGSSIGTAGGGLLGLSYHNGKNFSTYDRDQTGYIGGNCAITDRGGWWYNTCSFVNLNGEYVTPGTVSSYHNGFGGVIYYVWSGVKSLKATKMMFRRK